MRLQGEGREIKRNSRSRVMQLNLILLFQDDFKDCNIRVRLQGRRLNHILEVHRAMVGDELSVGLLNDRIGTGKVVALSQSALELDVKLNRLPPSKLPLTVILALPRPKFLKRVLRSLSSMGVQRIILINSFRVEKSYWQSPLLSQEHLLQQLVLGLEQAGDTILPEILLKPLFKPFVEDELPDIASGTVSLVAHPDADKSCPCGINQPTTLVIGPEGGFIPYEIEKLAACGFQTVRVSDRILSVETAVPALIARLF
jgi:16S rRNA (uracil1498-N3)-methyltransferase